MTPDRQNGLLKIESLDDEDVRKIWDVIHRQSILYAHGHNLDITDREQYASALNICVHSYEEGRGIAATRLSGENPSQVAIAREAIAISLDKREKTIRAAKRVRGEIKNFPFGTFGFDSPFLSELDSEINNSNHLLQIKKIEEFPRTFKKRKEAIKSLSTTILRSVSGIEIEDSDSAETSIEFNKILGRVDTVDKQSMVVRGYLCASLLNIMKSKSEFTPIFISHEALIDMVSNYKFFDAIPKNQKFVLISSLLVNLGVKKEEFSSARELFAAYYDQLITTLKNWMTTPIVRDEIPKTTPKYWKRIREFFQNYPIDPVSTQSYFDLNPETVMQANKAGILHLWKYAALVDEYWIPSSQDLAMAKEISRKAPVLEALALSRKIGAAELAWKRYTTAKFLAPTKLANEEERLGNVQEEISSYPSETSMKDFTRLQQRYHKAERKVETYERAIRFNEQIKECLDEADENPESYLALAEIAMYQEMSKGELSRKVMSIRRVITTSSNRLSKPGWLHMTNLRIDVGSLEDPTFIQILLNKAEEWKQQMEENKSLVIPREINSPEDISKTLQDMSYFVKRRGADEQVARAVNFMNSQEGKENLRKLFISDIRVTVRTLKTLLDNSEKIRNMENALKILDSVSKSADINTKRELIGELSWYFTKEREMLVRASLLPSNTNIHTVRFATSLVAAKNFLDFYKSAYQKKHKNFILPSFTEKDKIIAAEKEKLRISLLRLMKKRTAAGYRQSLAFFEKLEDMGRNSVFAWDKMAGLPIKIAIPALKRRLETAVALLNIEEARAARDEIKFKSDSGISLTKYLALKEKLNTASHNVKYWSDEIENADRYLIESMQGMGFALPVDTLDK